LDFLFDYEFRQIFNRISEKVDLRGANTPEEVNRRLHQKINEYPSRLSSGWISFFRKLIPSFGRRTIDQVIAKPSGIVALTLKYGRKTARRISLEQARNKLENLRKREKNKK